MSMAMSTKGVLFVLLVAYSTCVAHGFTTWISNGASRTIVATTSYSTGSSKFVGRHITPGTSQSDQYSTPLGVHVLLWVDGAGHFGSLDIDSDVSLVGYDQGAGSSGVNIYKAKHGTLFQRDSPVLLTIFLNGLRNSTTPELELVVDGSGLHNVIVILSDKSLVAYDHGASSKGVDIYYAEYGTFWKKEPLHS